MSIIDSNTMIMVVGAGGYMGKSYMSILIQDLGIPQRQIIAVDVNGDHLMAVRQKYPGVVCLTSVLQAESHHPSVAIVLVNTLVHLDVLRACCKIGVENIFIEKPLVYNSSELAALSELEFKKFFVGYVINFSGVVDDFITFMKTHNLVILHALTVWGKNWCAVERPMGGDAEEEMTHPLALIYSLVDAVHGVDDASLNANLSYVPFVQPHLVEQVKSQGVMYPDRLNDSTAGMLSMDTSVGEIHAMLLSSFGMFDQERRVEFTLAESADAFPLYKARLIFDVGSGANRLDTLHVKHAQTDEPFMQCKSAGNKIANQLKAALLAFCGGVRDPRLVGRGRAGRFVLLLDSVVG